MKKAKQTSISLEERQTGIAKQLGILMFQVKLFPPNITKTTTTFRELAEEDATTTTATGEWTLDLKFTSWHNLCH